MLLFIYMHIVIGGSDGLGEAIIESLNTSGVNTLNIARRNNSNAHLNVKSDLSKESGISAAVKEITAIKEPLEAVYFSAGVFSFQGMHSISTEEYERVFSINLKALILLTSSLLDRFKRDGTDIIFINSVAGIRSYKDQALYNASKAALRSFTNDLRIELIDTKSRVVGIYPGMIDTDLAQKLPNGPLPKSKKVMIQPKVLADYITYTQRLPKSIEVSDIILDRKK